MEKKLEIYEEWKKYDSNNNLIYHKEEYKR